MKFNKILSLILVVTLAMSLLAGCGSKEDTQPANKETTEDTTEGTTDTTTEEEVGYADGTYFAVEDEFASNGWKGTVILEVEGGKIVAVDWNAVNKNGGVDKKIASETGLYPLVEVGGGQAPWHEQAEKVESYLIQTQDPTAIEYKDDEGSTDAIAGVSIKVKGFYALVEKALAGPTVRGAYKDGAYSAEEAGFVNGWKGTANITVLYGNILAVNWNAINEEDETLDKKTASIEGNYPMVENAGAQAPWHEQAEKAEAYLIETQDPTAIEYKDDEGHTDAIAGVSIHVNDFYALVEEALADAK